MEAEILFGLGLIGTELNEVKEMLARYETEKANVDMLKLSGVKLKALADKMKAKTPLFCSLIYSAGSYGVC